MHFSVFKSLFRNSLRKLAKCGVTSVNNVFICCVQCFHMLCNNHCSEFQIFWSLKAFNFSVLSLYPNSVLNQGLHFLTTANQDKLTSFSHVLYPCHWLIKGGFSAKLTNSWFSPLLWKGQGQMEQRQEEFHRQRENFWPIKDRNNIQNEKVKT